jgi:Na+-driven multidrug efflux pump
MIPSNPDCRQTLLCSRRAYAAFLFSAWWCLVFGGVLALFFATWDETTNHFVRVLLPATLGCLGAVGSIAGLVIFFGMFAYLIRCDQSSRRSKALWLITFLIAWCFGSSVYFFAVYRRQQRPISTNSAPAEPNFG